MSRAVLGLVSLLQPMEWVAPLIPMLPDKLIDMIESPVPLIAGVVIHDLGKDKVKDGEHIAKLLDKSM